MATSTKQKESHKWIILHSSMAIMLPRVDRQTGKQQMDRYNKPIWNYRGIEQDEPIVLTANFADNLMESGRGRKPRAKDFEDKIMPDYSPEEMADESID